MGMKTWWRSLSDATQDAIEQVGHVGLGILLGIILGPLAALAIWIREFSTWKLGWPMAGQWPSGKPFMVGSRLVTTMDRLEDQKRDLLWSFFGTAIGSAAQVALLVIFI